MKNALRSAVLVRQVRPH